MSHRHLLVAFLSVLASCESKPNPTPTRSAEPAAPSQAAPAVPVAPVATKSYPTDIQLSEVTRKLGCPQGKAKNACEILSQFAKAGRFTGETPSGESRWLGRVHIVEKGTERTEYRLLHCHKVPTAKVGPSSLPLMLSSAELPIEVQVEAKRMWISLSHGRHRANRRNLAFKFIEHYEPKNEKGAIDTTGESVQLIGAIGEDVAYLRQPELKRLLWVQPSLTRDAAAGDGAYAEFWQATW